MIPQNENLRFNRKTVRMRLTLGVLLCVQYKKRKDMSEKIFSALRFATNAHSGQFRKSTKIPYIVHPIAVMQHLIKYNASDDAVAAGILHDTLEDTPTNESDLRQAFGNRITDLVMGASEPDKSQSWENRKIHTIETLRTVNDTEQLMVICADKLSNLSSIAMDLAQYGNDVWTRFNRGYEQQKWYYCSLAEIFANHTDKSQLFRDYIDVVNSVFNK